MGSLSPEIIRNSRTGRLIICFGPLISLLWLCFQAVPISAAPSQATKRSADRGEFEFELTRQLPAWQTYAGSDSDGTLIISRQGSAEAPRQKNSSFSAAKAAESSGYLLAALMPLIDVAPSEIALQESRRAGRLTYLFYRQLYRGIPLLGTQVCITTEAMQPINLAARLEKDLPEIQTQPNLSEGDSRQIAESDLEAMEIEWIDDELAILPPGKTGDEGYRLVWQHLCRTDRPEGAWLYQVDASSGAIIDRRSLVVQVAPAGISGLVSGELRTPTPFGQVGLHDYPNAIVEAKSAGAAQWQTQYTDENGLFFFDNLSIPAQARTSLEGRFVSVVENSLENQTPHLLSSVSSPEITLFWNDQNSSKAARSAYFHVNRAHQRLKEIDPGYTDLDFPVQVIVNDSTSSCNAWAYLIPTAPYLKFNIGGGFCQNSAEIADVVYHEYAHLITMYDYLPDWASDHFSEAFADYFAASAADCSLIGRDFYGDGSSLRDLNHDLIEPVSPSCAIDPHCEGLLLGGALWDIRSNLIASLPDSVVAVDLADSLFHFMRAARPHDYQSCLIQMLLLDDDDADLANGTAHLHQIAQGFAHHRIGDLEIHGYHHPLADTEDFSSPRDLVVILRSIYPIRDETVRLFYNSNGEEFAELAMSKDQGQYLASLPAMAAGTSVGYYITAKDESGRSLLMPANAPHDLYEYRVGQDLIAPEIMHRPLENLVTGSKNFWLEATVSDNSEQIRSVQAEVTITSQTGNRTYTVDLEPAPDTAEVDGEPATSTAIRYEGSVATGGLGEDDTVSYFITATDDSPQANSARLPHTEEITPRIIRGRGWDFEVQTPEIVADGDWKWGLAEAPVPQPQSGDHLFGTTLDGSYSPNQESILETPDFDLTDWTSGALEFDTWYQIEREYDGGLVEVSVDQGGTWELLIPIDGYPGVLALDQLNQSQVMNSTRAYNGSVNSWRRVRFSLGDLCGEVVRFRLRLVSSDEITDQGWYIDNLQIAETLILGAPADLAASAGGSSRVLLKWSPPAGIDLQSDEFLGYNLYRGDYPSQYDPLPLNDQPITRTWAIDTNGLSNGNSYYYVVTALYDAGESPPSLEALGLPYQAEIDVVSEIETTLSDGPVGELIVPIQNVGTGDLYANWFVGDVTDEWPDIHPEYGLLNPSETQLNFLLDDPINSGSPDLASLYCRSLNGYLICRINLHDSLPDPREDFTLDILLDTDLSRLSGIPFGNVGADYIARIGAQPYQATGELTSLLNAQMAWQDRLFSATVREGLGYIEVAIPRAAIGSPPLVALSLRVSEGVGIDPFIDIMPDLPQTTWLEIDGYGGSTDAEGSLKMNLRFDLSGFVEDDYQARLFIASNDPITPVHQIDLDLHLTNILPMGISEWAAVSALEGLALSWTHDEMAGLVQTDRATSQIAGFQIKRWGGRLSDEAEAICLNEDPLLPGPDQTYSYLDRYIKSGQRYFYRLTAVSKTGETIIVFSPPFHPVYAPPQPSSLMMSRPWPNPSAGEIAYRVIAPEGLSWSTYIVDISGRRIKRFSDFGDGVGGVYPIIWDGRGENGIPLPQGVYYAVVQNADQRISHKIVRIR